ncbi:hypothetical protein TURU_018053 [Turdus rufiventris]|nr:hypothetical protein TURU_018053 [Turdus rufiventris]
MCSWCRGQDEQQAAALRVEPIPDGSRVDLQLAKAGLISDGGSTPGIACSTKGKENQGVGAAGEKGVRSWESNVSADPQVSEEEEAGGVPGAGADYPAALAAAHAPTGDELHLACEMKIAKPLIESKLSGSSSSAQSTFAKMNDTMTVF